MARARLVSKSLSTSTRFHALNVECGQSGLTEFSQLLYVLLIVHADDFGRMEGDSLSVKLRVLPGSSRNDAEFTRALEFLEHVNLIQRQTIGELDVLQIVDFDRHQAGLHKRTKSIFPEIPGNSRKILSRTDLDLDLDLESEEKRTEEKRKDDTRRSIAGVDQEPSPNGQPPVWKPPAARPATILHGPELRRHGQHAYCGAFVPCVPLTLDLEFAKVGKKTGAELRVWYATTDKAYEGQAVGDDTFTFWKNLFAAWVGTVTARPRDTKHSRLSAILKGTI